MPVLGLAAGCSAAIVRVRNVNIVVGQEIQVKIDQPD